LLRPHPAARRHPPRAYDLGGAVDLDSPADERHGLRVAAQLRPGVRRAQALPLGLGQRGLRRRRGGLKLGLFTAAFGERPLDDVARWAAGAGFEALEVHCPPGVPLDFEPPELEISALSYYPNNLDPDDGAREAAHAHLRSVIDAAARLGVGLVCTFAGADPLRTLDENLER